MPSIVRGSVSGKLYGLAFETCTPVSATIELTTKCNLRCVHCYNFDRAAPAPVVTGSLTPAEIVDVIGQLADAGSLYLSFTGGETLLHPHLDDFIHHACGRTFAVSIKTNGTLLTATRAAQLAAAGAREVHVSLYGATAATHDAFVMQPGAFEKTVAGIRAAKAAGMDSRVSICLVRENASQVDAMLQLVEELGVRAGIDPQLTVRYDGTTSSLDHRVDRDTLLRLYRGPLRSLLGSPDCNPGRSVQCSCARAVCAISATGDVYPCIGSPIPSGNIRNQPFAEIWRTSPQLNRIRELTLDDFVTCKPCPDRAYCRRSSGVVYNNTGNYTGPEEWTCMEASVLRQVEGTTSVSAREAVIASGASGDGG
jgi:radical SAM protein with 4Fe4S-binding SPASM domain